MDLLLTVIVCPGYAIGPSISSNSDWPFETGFLCHGTRVDQYSILNGLGTSVRGYDVTEKSCLCVLDEGHAHAIVAGGLLEIS